MGIGIAIATWQSASGGRNRGRVYGTGDLSSQFFPGSTAFTMESRAATARTSADPRASEDSEHLRLEIERLRDSQRAEREEMEQRMQAQLAAQEERLRAESRRQMEDMQRDFERRMDEMMRRVLTHPDTPGSSRPTRRLPPHPDDDIFDSQDEDAIPPS